MKRLLLILFAIFLIASPVQGEFFKDVIVTSPTGIWTDSRAYTTLSAAVMAIGASEQDLYIAKEEVVTTLVIPANIRLHFLKDGAIANSNTLTINTKNIYADHQIFTGAGAVNFAASTEVRTRWFEDFETAITQTSNDTVTLLVDTADTLLNSAAVGDNVLLKWNASNLITIAAGQTLSNIGDIDAPGVRLFVVSGAIAFKAQSPLREIRADWFGSSLATLDIADNAAAAAGKPLLITPGNWIIDADLTLSSNLKVVQGTDLQIATLITLTLSGGLEAGPYRIFSCTGTGKVVFSNASQQVLPNWWGALFDGVTDDSSYFTAAFTAASVVVAGGTTAGDISIPSAGKTLICNKLTITGTFTVADVGDAGTLIYGDMIVLPPNGTTTAVSLDNCRRLIWNGKLTIGDTTPRTVTTGLSFSAGVASPSGTFYNYLPFVLVQYLTGRAIDFASDDAAALFTVGSNQIDYAQVRACGDGVRFYGASNNRIGYLNIENCTGDILTFAKTSGGSAWSLSNKIESFYSENAALTNWIVFDVTSKGTQINSANPHDGKEPPTSYYQAEGTKWSARYDSVNGWTIEPALAWGAGAIRSYSANFGFFNAYSEAYPRVAYTGLGHFKFGAGASAPTAAFGYQDTAMVGTSPGTHLSTGSGLRDVRAAITSTANAITLTDVASYFTVTLTENITSITFPTTAGYKIITIRFTQAGGGGGLTVAGWPADVLLAGGSYTMTATAGKNDVLKFQYDGSLSRWIEISRSQNM